MSAIDCFNCIKMELGHHPHIWRTPVRLFRFILRATDHRKFDCAIVPAPSGRSRSAARWKEGKDWWVPRPMKIDSNCAASKRNDYSHWNSHYQGWGEEIALMSTYAPR